MAVTTNHQLTHSSCNPLLAPRLPTTTTTTLLFLFLSATISSHASPPLPKGFSLELVHTQYPQQDLFLNDDSTTPRPSIHYRPFTYMVNITLPPQQSYLLTLDTGSGLVWTQCKPCKGCPPQAHAPFDPTRSPTNMPLSCPTPNSHCSGSRYECKGGVCHYNISYINKSSMEGRLSFDTFSFGGFHQYWFLFGCTHSMANWRGASGGYPEGVFGMNQHKFSFATQMSRFSDSLTRFSYCFTDPTATRSSSFLRFGDDIPPMSGTDVQGIKMDSGTCGGGHYYFDLRDISLDKKRLNLTVGTFARREDGNGGFAIDTGSSVSLLVAPAYDAVRAELVKHFGKYDLRRVEQWKEWRLDLCYEMPEISISWPVMTLHFPEANMVINQIFLRGSRMFCWAMVRSDEHTLLGAVQQRNVRFVFDLKEREVRFAEEDCALGG